MNALRIAVALALVVAGCFVGARAAAQERMFDAPAAADDAKPGMNVSLGWSERMTLRRWNPIRVSVIGGEQAAAGTIVVRSTGYGSDPVEIVAPFVATPRKTTPVDLAMVRDGRDAMIDVSMFDERGRRIARMTFGDPGSKADIALRPALEPGAALIACVGESSIARARRAMVVASGDDAVGSEDGFLADAEVVAARAADMPRVWTGYDSLSALVLDSGAMGEIEEEARRAVMEWVAAGGRLVLVCDQPGGAQARWMAPGMVEVEPMERPGGEGLSRRPIRLLDGGRDAGWRVMEWPGGAAVERGWIAEGPAGLGWIVVMGADPVRMAGEGAPRLGPWSDVLGRVALREWAEEAGRGIASMMWRWESDHEERMLAAAYDALADGMDVGLFPFWMLAVFLIALAAAIGPVDWFVLKRMRKQHRSWLTAIGWVGIFSVVAYAAPFALRSGETQARRMTLLDVSTSEAIAMRSGALAVFPGRTESAALRGGTERAWWSARSSSFGVGSDSGPGARRAALRMTQSGGDGSAPERLRLRVWSLLTMADEAPASPVYDAAVTADAEEGLRVRISGLGGRKPTNVAVLTSDGWRGVRADAEDGAGEDGAWTGVARGEANPGAAWWRSADELIEQRARTMQYAHVQQAESLPQSATGLPGAARRTALMEARARTGKWAVVCFELADGEMDVSLEMMEADQSAVELVRVLTPFDGEAAPEVGPWPSGEAAIEETDDGDDEDDGDEVDDADAGEEEETP